MVCCLLGLQLPRSCQSHPAQSEPHRTDATAKKMHITCCLSHNKSNKSQQLSVKNCQLVQKFYFLLLLRDAVQKRGHGACLDVCLSRSCIVSKIVNIMLELIHFPVVRIFWFFHTKYYGEIPTEFPLIGASNAGAV